MSCPIISPYDERRVILEVLDCYWSLATSAVHARQRGGDLRGNKWWDNAWLRLMTILHADEMSPDEQIDGLISDKASPLYYAVLARANKLDVDPLQLTRKILATHGPTNWERMIKTISPHVNHPQSYNAHKVRQRVLSLVDQLV